MQRWPIGYQALIIIQNVILSVNSVSIYPCVTVFVCLHAICSWTAWAMETWMVPCCHKLSGACFKPLRFTKSCQKSSKKAKSPQRYVDSTAQTAEGWVLTKKSSRKFEIAFFHLLYSSWSGQAGCLTHWHESLGQVRITVSLSNAAWG